MKAVADLLLRRHYTRRCDGCAVQEFHTDHLTRLGRWRFA